MRLLVTGATGMIGTALAGHVGGEHEIARLVRSTPAGPGDFRWDPLAGEVDPAALEGVEAIVHLAGETVAGRWTESKKRRIRDSRVLGTRALASAAAATDSRPRVMVCASAIGYYGDRGDERLTEDSPPGTGFLAEVVQEWEAAAEPARAAGIRVVNLRFGIVQSAEGGALKTMLPLFRLGLGGRLGDGRQYVSWVSVDDTVGAIGFALARDDVSGALNVTAPEPVTQAEHARTLGHVLGRPAVLPAPAFAIRAVLGEFAGEVLTGARVLPERLSELGYVFRHRELEPALRDLLGRESD